MHSNASYSISNWKYIIRNINDSTVTFHEVLSSWCVWHGRSVMYMRMGLFYSQLVVRHIPKLRSKNSEELDYEIILPSRNETSFATATRTSERRSAWKFAHADEAKITALVISRLPLSLHYYVWCVEARFELLPRAKNASVKRSIYNPVQSR